jgi:rhodanese-related sulfurtransferase
VAVDAASISGMSSVTSTPAATADDARRHFEARLAFETDAADVGEAVAKDRVDFVLLDVRSPAAYAAGHVPGAVSLPHARIDRAALDALGDDRLLVVYCWGPGCNGAQHAAAKVAALGRRVKEMLGGWEYYVREGWPVEGGEVPPAAADALGLVRLPTAA